jgi:demethylmenaquinone methyltransferase/2-methoxy-6-polyprenyl-1,4-benzoquinol methylase
VRTASTITAVDASPEMIEINKAKVSSDRISYVLADIFSWQPARVYDGVLFSFWISHVPLERLDDFLRSVRTMLRPGGKVFFVDGRRELTSTAINHQLPAQESQTSIRTLNNGKTFEIVKNFYVPNKLAAQCNRLGFDITVRETAT